MRAGVLTDVGTIEVREVPDAEAGEDQLLLRVVACGICGTDVRTFSHGDPRAPVPWILGHEVVGVVEEVGSRAADEVDVAQGDLVFVASILSCGRCEWCRAGKSNLCELHELLGYDPHPGAYAERFVVPRIALRGVFRVPEGLAPEVATIADPLSNTINGQEILGAGLGDTVVVIGAGPIGCMHAAIARSRGAAQVLVFDVSEDRAELARKVLGNDRVETAAATGDAMVDAVMEATGGRGAERIVVACSSHEAQQDALRMTAKEAKVVYFGGLPKHRPTIEFDSNVLHYREVQVAGAYGANLRQMDDALRMLADEQIPGDRLVTHKVPLEEIGSAFQALVSGEALKAVILPGG
jgi:L-iditol 2-dehydrogenase